MTEEARELIITGDAEPDEPDEPAGEGNWEPVAVGPDSHAYETPPPTQTYRAPRGKWDFTDGQRIIIAFLIWLNIIVLFIGYLAVTDQVSL
jgi:hypothetical protein